MRKNVAGQVIAAQLVSKTDGGDVTTGTTTVYLEIDGGVQASIGTATHLGSGSWSFAPSQANTNGNHLKFTFVNPAAVTVGLNIFTVSYNPHDTAGLGLSRLDVNVGSRMETFNYEAPDNEAAQAAAAIAAEINGRLPASPAAVGSAMTVTDKTGFKLAADGLDSISTTAPTGVAVNFREMVVQTWRRWFGKVEHDPTAKTLKTYRDDGTTVVTTQSLLEDADTGVETQGAAN